MVLPLDVTQASGSLQSQVRVIGSVDEQHLKSGDAHWAPPSKLVFSPMVRVGRYSATPDRPTNGVLVRSRTKRK